MSSLALRSIVSTQGSQYKFTIIISHTVVRKHTTFHKTHVHNHNERKNTDHKIYEVGVDINTGRY